MSDLCPVCKGSGTILTTKRGLEWWTCLCGGTGVVVQYGPAVYARKPKKE